MADTLDARFLPYDPDRSLNNIKGATVRLEPWDNWRDILKLTRESFMLKAVLFGQESVGKTTLTKLVSKRLKIKGIFEYARPYLETVGNELSEEKMEEIYLGQAALQRMFYLKAETPVLLMDTDLFSTLGYYAIGDYFLPDGLKKEAQILRGDVYYLLPDAEVPFEIDPLRYGGDKRESSREFWEDILIAEELNFVKVHTGSLDDKVDFIATDLLLRFEEKFKEIKKFLRT